MIKDRKIPTSDLIALEKYYASLETSRTLNPREHNNLIKKHLADYLTHKFIWDYWITFEFGYKPDLEDVEDILHITHHRVDKRILKHSPHPEMKMEDRSEWILFPELGGRGLHYHGFIKLHMKPNLGRSYETEWYWMRAAFLDTFKSLTEKYGHIGFHVYERKWRWMDELKVAMYSMKEFCEGVSYMDLNNSFDRLGYTIFSTPDWKPSRILKHRGSNKIDGIPMRANKVGPLELN